MQVESGPWRLPRRRESRARGAWALLSWGGRAGGPWQAQRLAGTWIWTVGAQDHGKFYKYTLITIPCAQEQPARLPCLHTHCL